MADLDCSSTSNNASMDSPAFETDKEETWKLEFSEDEDFLVAKMFNLVGERWSLIAGRIPGRTAEEIEKYWNSRHSTRHTIWRKNKCRKVERPDYYILSIG
ncbi:MYB-like transcription factor ETC3 isoform X2 [Solanum dulcamara]|uniref:MYB-like transcription factor ETC3 isoform X2 n=1 Tax=Solanum dulcamara TaxID=45834 RepID=UPI00248696EE|nr:MYB-like transcription factor ETC3 isoform X2 [Solanum dulcamara]